MSEIPNCGYEVTNPETEDWEKGYWNKRAIAYGINAPAYSGIDRDNEPLAKIIDTFVGQHGKLLDFGCGTGRNFDVLSRHCKEYYGVDYSEEMLKLFKGNRQLRPNDVLAFADIATQIPYPDGYFDAAFSNAVMQHIVAPSKFFKAVAEIKRVLKPGGTVYAHEAMVKGTLVKQAYPYQRIRPIKTYGEVFFPEISLLDHGSFFPGMAFCSGIKNIPAPNGGKVILDIGCGKQRAQDALGIDVRSIHRCGARKIDFLADGKHLPFQDGTVDEVICESVLEHLENPYEILLEAHRVLKQDGTASFVVPYPGTHSSQGDKSHVFITDVDHWGKMFKGFFDRITIYPLGVFFPANPKWEEWQKKIISKGMYGMSQGGKFVCSKPLAIPQIMYIPWWLEDWARETFGEDVV